MRIFRLDEVCKPARLAPGRMRATQPEDTALLEQWIRAFGDDVGETFRDPGRAAREGVAWGDLVVWDVAGEPRSMAARTRPTPNGCGVNLVYTPPSSRGKGYASALVAALSERLLKTGYDFCFLYTDLANPTSNHIYQEIGYHAVGDAEEWHFE